MQQLLPCGDRLLPFGLLRIAPRSPAGQLAGSVGWETPEPALEEGSLSPSPISAGAYRN